MRLIDADLLLNEVYKKCNCMDSAYEVIKIITDQPTAFDKEKVLKKLNNLRNSVPVNRLLDDIINDKPKELGQLMAYDKSIEIVKKGGLDELRKDN